MTDRVNALTVILDRDIREDDIEPVVRAIEQIKHVIAVETNTVSIDDAVAEARVKLDYKKKLFEVLV